MSNKLVLIDGNSIIYRAFFALPLLNNNKGVYTNAIYGFTTMLMRILDEEKPTHMLVAFDAGKTTFRHKTFKEYKGGRQKTPPELSEQFPLARELLDAFQIPHYELDLYEADDIIGTLAADGDKHKWDVKVISGDQDLLQLVSDSVTVDLTKRGISEVDSYTPSFMKEKMEVLPDQIIDLKALMGDSSDNIPGVPGVGIKTATKLLKEYKTLDDIYKNIDKLGGKKLKENLTTYKEDAYTSRELVTIKLDSPIDISLANLTYTGYEQAKVEEIFKELEFRSLLKRIGAEENQDELSDVKYSIVTEITEDMFTNETGLVLEMITDNYHHAPIEGIGVVNDQAAYFVPTELALESDIFKRWAEDPSKEKLVFDAKGTLVSLLSHGVHLRGVTFDLLLASYLINSADNHHDIPSIAHRFEKTDVLFDEDVYGKGAKLAVPSDQTILADHIIRKSMILYELKQEMEQELKENDQYDLYMDLEMPLSLILAEMEHTGVQIDVEQLKKMGADLADRLKVIEEDVHGMAGEEFNLNSPKQLGVILFDKLELPVIKRTKTGYSTAADVLDKLEDKHEIIPRILLYRQLRTLHSTFIEGLLKVVDKDTNKIHTRFNQALTQTGRLSSVDPNLQNIPVRLEEGRKIRQAFVPSEKGWYIFAADYSQIELRVLAHIAKDERLITAFNNNDDIHTLTASDVFHVHRDDVTDDMREQSKAVNFGIVYGISDYGLSQNLGITRKEAKKFIDRYFEIYPGVKVYMEDIVQDAKHKGYVTTIMNRRRYLPELMSRNFNQRSFAERTAMNTPIQGSAADIIKKAMIDLRKRLVSEELSARILLQVHDELIIEAPEKELSILKQLVSEVMEKTVDLIVPLKVDYSYGKSWYDAQ